MSTFAIINRIAALNKLHAWLDQMMPELRSEVQNKDYRVTVDQVLFKRDKERLSSIVKQAMPLDVTHAYFKYSSHSKLTLNIRMRYKNRPEDNNNIYGWNYVTKTICIDHPQGQTEFKQINVDEVLTEVAKLSSMQAKVRELQHEISRITMLAYGR